MASYRAFGLTLESETPLPCLAAPSGRADVAVRWIDPAALGWSGPARHPVWETRFPDGQSVRAEIGTAGDQLLVYGDRARFHLSADLRTIACAARDEADPHCQRFLLDTVLWWLCLSRGQQVVHAGAVETEHGVLAVAAATGAGKTTLCAELLRRGANLFSDDVLVVERGAGGPIAYPGPPLMNLPSEAGYPADFGRAIARFPAQAESWVAVERAAERPQPVAALFLLRRAPGLPLAAERREATVLDLLPHLWGLPHATEGPQERFQLASDLAATTPIYDLTADPEVPAATLADLVHGAVAGPVSEPILEGSAAR